jgi:uncharacterized protein (TIGR02596 family)
MNSPRPPFLRGFSLLELLTVIAVMAIAVALIAAPFTQIVRASGLGHAGDQILATLSQARQIAAARNRTVEVRFYKYVDASQPTEGRFHAMQLFVVETAAQGTTTNAVARSQTMPATVFIASGTALSSLLDPAVTTPTAGSALGVKIPSCGLNYSASTFRIYPDGSTSFTNAQPKFLTVVPSNTPDEATVPPANYATIVLEPSNGKARLHRP